MNDVQPLVSHAYTLLCSYSRVQYTVLCNQCAGPLYNIKNSSPMTLTKKNVTFYSSHCRVNKQNRQTNKLQSSVLGLVLFLYL